MRVFLGSFVCMFLAMASLAHAQAPIPGRGADAEIARRYFDALIAGDHDALRPLLAEDAAFEDPTIRVEGRDAIVAAWERQNIRITGYTGQTAFFSDAGQYVFSGSVRFEQTFQRAAGGAPLTFTFETSYVVVLRVTSGRIDSHRDYVDTSTFAEQLNAQIAAVRAQEAP